MQHRHQQIQSRPNLQDNNTKPQLYSVTMNQPPNFPASTSTPLEYSLFSPSKAAEQQRLAKDWDYVHQFLRQKYPSPQKVPKFEENEETLRMLLAVAAANEKADEGWGVL
ncbi:hypothetical protein KCU71_g8358, partial [Aureobasidium melanogenum]